MQIHRAGAIPLLAAFSMASAGCSRTADQGDEERVGVAASAIQGGAVDRTNSGVVGVIASASDTVRVCTGTLISPNVVLTARHCVSRTSRDIQCGASLFGASIDPSSIHVTQSPDLRAAESAGIAVAEVRVIPKLDEVCGADLAILVLDAATGRGATPVVPRLDPPVEPDEVYAAVGYGDTSPSNAGSGIRRRRDALHVLCAGSTCGSGDVSGTEWRGDFGACAGDSGGPALDADDAQIGVVSRGPAGCDAPVYTALPPFAGWITDETTRAASLADIDAPSWTRTGTTAAALSAEGGGCAICAPGATTGEAASGVLAALGAIAAAAGRRRRA